MFPHSFLSLQFYQKKKDIVLYKASDVSHRYILKAIIPKDSSVKQAFYDEYHTLHSLHHPSIPVYYGLAEHFHFPDFPGEYLALCMEDCSLPKNQLINHCTIKNLGQILNQVTEVLSYLLDKGVLYTDLNPSNLILSRQEKKIHLTMVDYTYCYYFLRNPKPDYSLRFSYNLSPKLKGQQLLIQEITYLACALMEDHRITGLSSNIYRLLETGKNPPEGLSLQDFSLMIQESFI